MLRMNNLEISRSSSIFIKLGQDRTCINVGSKTRSVGQSVEKPCEHSRGHIFSPIFIKLAQNDHLDNNSVNSNMGHATTKTRSVGQFIGKPYEHSRGNSFGPILPNLVAIEYGSLWVKD